jgi:hypothetical protein
MRKTKVEWRRFATAAGAIYISIALTAVTDAQRREGIPSNLNQQPSRPKPDASWGDYFYYFNPINSANDGNYPLLTIQVVVMICAVLLSLMLLNAKFSKRRPKRT